MKAEDNKELFA